MRTIVSSLVSVALGVAFFAAATPVTSFVSNEDSIITQDSREADREAIRAHVDRIFRAYVNKDLETVRATHADNWTGFTISARSIIRWSMISTVRKISEAYTLVRSFEHECTVDHDQQPVG